MGEIKNINLAFACQQKEDLKKTDAHTFLCEKCQHSVLDFTKKTDTELLESLNSSDKRVCGIFKKTQLSNRFIRYAALSIFAGSSFTFNSYAQEIKIDSTGPIINPESDSNDLFYGIILEEMARPKFGYEALYEAINIEMSLPKDYDGYGKVYVQFTVDTTGSVKDLNIIKGLDNIADSETLRIFKKIDFKFIPAKQRNKNVESRLILPVRIRMKND